VKEITRIWLVVTFGTSPPMVGVCGGGTTLKEWGRRSMGCGGVVDTSNSARPARSTLSWKPR